MTATRRSLLAGAVAAASSGPLGACATGTRVAEMGGRIAPIPAGMGRVWFFRDIEFVWLPPSILLNGRAVGRSVSNGAFFRDVPPGDYHLALTTPARLKLTFTVAAGEERFVRISEVITVDSLRGSYSSGGTIADLVNPKRGRAAVATKVFTNSHWFPRLVQGR